MDGLKEAFGRMKENMAAQSNDETAEGGEHTSGEQGEKQLHSVHTNVHNDGSFGVHAHFHDGTSESSHHKTHEEAAAKHHEHLKAHAAHHGKK